MLLLLLLLLLHLQAPESAWLCRLVEDSDPAKGEDLVEISAFGSFLLFCFDSLCFVLVFSIGLFGISEVVSVRERFIGGSTLVGDFLW